VKADDKICRDEEGIKSDEGNAKATLGPSNWIQVIPKRMLNGKF